MVKYTGFGNAAGHLAQKGLMCGGRGPIQYSSSSEDSDTEEYLEAQPHIDPVVGCTRPPRINPFENMTEEQVCFIIWRNPYLKPHFLLLSFGMAFCDPDIPLSRTKFLVNLGAIISIAKECFLGLDC